MDNRQPDETKDAPQRYDQRVFFTTVVGLAKIAAAEHIAATGDDKAVSADTILSDLCANLMACAIVGDESGKLMVALTLKAEQQAAEAMRARTERLSREIDVIAAVNGGWKRA